MTDLTRPVTRKVTTPTRSLRCPTTPRQTDGSLHTVIGCGSTNVTAPDAEGIVDCCDCGIWFTPAQETDK